MQAQKKTTTEKIKKEKSGEAETAKKLPDDKIKKNNHGAATPRAYQRKSTAADIYTQKSQTSLSSVKAPRKSLNTTRTTKESPMKDLLKSTSNVSVVSKSSIDKTAESSAEAKRTTRLSKELPFLKANSPVTQKRKILDDKRTTIVGRSKLEREESSAASKKEIGRLFKINSDSLKNEGSVARSTKRVTVPENVKERQRSKTRTLDENEVKILTADVVDNNAEMRNLSKKLTAQPKAFFVGLDDGESKEKTSEDEVSYEDDFESYESDFESYHSDASPPGDGSSADSDDHTEPHHEVGHDRLATSKEVRDEENMLDSGSYDLRDRSAKAKASTMEFIVEDSEDHSDKKPSLTDEGFQEMSSSSAVSSLRTVHECIDRQNFIDFGTRSREWKRKRRVLEMLKRRAADILGMVSLHEVSYVLFEAKPIAYEKYMSSFGRSGRAQNSSQTFDDGANQETQTDEILLSHKWTQNPVDFTYNDIYVYPSVCSRKYSECTVDYMARFSFLTKSNDFNASNVEIEMDDVYKRNPLRIYLEQRNGVGTGEMLPYEKYESRLKGIVYERNRLRRFLKRTESKIFSALNKNAGKRELIDLNRNTKLPFSQGYVMVNFNVDDDRLNFIVQSKVTKIIYSKAKSNLIMTVHSRKDLNNKRVLCIWDVGVARFEPIKILISIDGIILGQFQGNTDGIFVAALEDGSIHLWELSEEPTWRSDVASDRKSTNLKELTIDEITPTEKDRELNLNSDSIDSTQEAIPCALQACAFTTSAFNLSCAENADRIIGLELTAHETREANGRRVLGQTIVLQRTGKLCVWLIVRDKNKSSFTDIGKAYSSRTSLEMFQTILLSDYIDSTIEEGVAFDLCAAKRRLTLRRRERIEFSRPNTAKKFECDVTRAKSNTVLPADKRTPTIWESMICYDLKIVNVGNIDHYLVAKNVGEVLSCKKSVGGVKVRRFRVTNDKSLVTNVQVAPALPYFMASTESGTVNLCSLLENRVLLTLDCRNISPAREPTERCRSDSKGRYISSVAAPAVFGCDAGMMSVTSLIWPPSNPCQIFALLKDGSVVAWDLTTSDIYGKVSTEKCRSIAGGQNSLALLTHEGSIQLHKLKSDTPSDENMKIFNKYVALL
ncbi:cytoplasmic dynein 2 intermediate chain 1 isoform X2 [Bombyx mori]|uniref:WD repeat-containing protein 60 n=1 Tax=Bombyx mori TaxID=7091 RepID=A0A8R2R5C8_BOMMO|nr:cytoplasmic dynein 2 intermediate chain 1 [Bombyx mori]